MQTIELPCPECGESNTLQLSELANGREISCQHCASSLFLTCYRDIPDDPPTWHLESNVGLQDMERRT